MVFTISILIIQLHDDETTRDAIKAVTREKIHNHERYRVANLKVHSAIDSAAIFSDIIFYG